MASYWCSFRMTDASFYLDGLHYAAASRTQAKVASTRCKLPPAPEIISPCVVNLRWIAEPLLLVSGNSFMSVSDLRSPQATLPEFDIFSVPVLSVSCPSVFTLTPVRSYLWLSLFLTHDSNVLWFSTMHLQLSGSWVWRSWRTPAQTKKSITIISIPHLHLCIKSKGEQNVVGSTK